MRLHSNCDSFSSCTTTRLYRRVPCRHDNSWQANPWPESGVRKKYDLQILRLQPILTNINECWRRPWFWPVQGVVFAGAMELGMRWPSSPPRWRLGSFFEVHSEKGEHPGVKNRQYFQVQGTDQIYRQVGPFKRECIQLNPGHRPRVLSPNLPPIHWSLKLRRISCHFRDSKVDPTMTILPDPFGHSNVAKP